MHSFCVFSKRVFVQLNVKFSLLSLWEGASWDHLPNGNSLNGTKTGPNRKGAVIFFFFSSGLLCNIIFDTDENGMFKMCPPH